MQLFSFRQAGQQGPGLADTAVAATLHGGNKRGLPRDELAAPSDLRIEIGEQLQIRAQPVLLFDQQLGEGGSLVWIELGGELHAQAFDVLPRNELVHSSKP